MDDLVEFFTFTGRASRSRFWLIQGLTCVYLITALLTFGILTEALGPIFILGMLGAAYMAAWAGLAVCVKRLHDMDRPGSHFFLFAVPIYNLYLGLLLCSLPGTPGPNRYGSDPLARRYWHRIEG